MDKDEFSKIRQDKNIFCKIAYTHLSEAKKILEERQKDKKLIEKIEKILKNNIPEPLKKIDKNGVLFRQVATPNYEARWFIELTKDHGFKSIFFEYFLDKFTSNNYYKHSLGQLIIHKDSQNKNGGNIEEKITIVDFNKFNGKKLKDVLTTWGESLIDFHKRLFGVYYKNQNNLYFYDASVWFKENGPSAINYYTNLMLLFICHGVLFENFLLAEDEGDFTENIFLPAFMKASELAGVKPLIVPIPPMDPEIEEDVHWHSHTTKVKSLLNLK